MKTTKLVFFYIFVLIAIVNAILMYINTPIENLRAMVTFSLTLFVLAISALFMCIAALSNKRFTKKLMFRLQLILLIILVISSIVLRVREALAGNWDSIYFIWRVGATVLYFIVFLFAVGLSRDVFKLLLAIFNSKKNN